MNKLSQTAILLLEDGHIFYGQAFGKIGTTSGELCFNTGMTGYQEVFTDPSYTGQVLIMNNVHIGNYGVKDIDVESNSVKIRGLIGRNLEEQFSRIQAKGNLQDYLVANNLVAIEGIDTRALVAHIRTSGAMNCIISSEILDEDKLKTTAKILYAVILALAAGNALNTVLSPTSAAIKAIEGSLGGIKGSEIVQIISNIKGKI
jgi:carbamoyl-phosphate synthase small subunit